MNNNDKRNKLDEEVFTYKVTKENKVLIYWFGKQVKMLSGKESEKFLAKIAGKDEKELQLILAKITGNFKRGNEKNEKRI